MLYGMLVGRNSYEVRQVDVMSDDIPLSFDGYRIVHISDLHLRSFRSRPASLERAVRKINSLDPDLVLFTGDMVTAQPSEMDSLEVILSGVHASDGVYSVLGNHDYCIYHRWDSDSLRLEAVREVVRRQESMGWQVLMNGHVDIVRQRSAGDPLSVQADTISVIGVENISGSPYFPSYGDVTAASAGAYGDFRILMSHDPTSWKRIVSDHPEIDLTLSGHTHAMQFSVFGWSPASLVFPEYSGMYLLDADGMEGHEKGRRVSVCHRDGSHMLYVNTGLGETAIPARIGADPEITLLVLDSVTSGR